MRGCAKTFKVTTSVLVSNFSTKFPSSPMGACYDSQYMQEVVEKQKKLDLYKKNDLEDLEKGGYIVLQDYMRDQPIDTYPWHDDLQDYQCEFEGNHDLKRWMLNE